MITKKTLKTLIRIVKFHDKGVTHTLHAMSIYSVGLLFVGCGVNGVALEVIMGLDRDCGALLSFMQTAFVTLASVHWARPKTPLRFYALLTAIYWLNTMLYHGAFAYHVSQPLHMVARSASPVVSYVLGYLFFGKREQPMRRFVAVLAITLGVIITARAESHVIAATQYDCHCAVNDASDHNVCTATKPLHEWLIGVTLLMGAMICASLLGHIQEWGYGRWGRDVAESQFYTSALSLLYFSLTTHDMQRHWTLWSTSAPLRLGQSTWPISTMWAYVIVHCVTHYICVRSVYALIGQVGALSTTLLLTLRKFLSLLFSVWYFDNVFYASHWFGALLVLLGCMYYAEPLSTYRDFLWRVAHPGHAPRVTHSH